LRLKHRVLFIVGEFRPLMVRKRAALLVLYNVSGETTVTAHSLPSRLTRSLGSSPWNLCSLPDAAMVRKDHNSEQYLAAINN